MDQSERTRIRMRAMRRRKREAGLIAVTVDAASHHDATSIKSFAAELLDRAKSGNETSGERE